jgi:hypothetical protein
MAPASRAVVLGTFSSAEDKDVKIAPGSTDVVLGRFARAEDKDVNSSLVSKIVLLSSAEDRDVKIALASKESRAAVVVS